MDDDINIIHCEQARLSFSFPPKTLFCFSFHPKNRSTCKGTPNIGHFDALTPMNFGTTKHNHRHSERIVTKHKKKHIAFLKNLSRQDSRLGLIDEKTSTVTCPNSFYFNCLACLGKTRGHVTHKSCTYGFYFSAVQQFR